MARRSKGEGSIFKHKDGYWTGQVELPNGKRKTKYFKSQKEAREWVRDPNQSINQGIWVEKENIILADFLNQYMEDVGAHTLRPKTIDSYSYLIRKHIIPELGH